ncbi:hypothetical protein LZ30DRAFT_46647 [Colletotrichum cereale]|nr:hypothetical protein LZ30DRAFT_46647 [Colletotrichum cereale]
MPGICDAASYQRFDNQKKSPAGPLLFSNTPRVRRSSPPRSQKVIPSLHFFPLRVPVHEQYWCDPWLTLRLLACIPACRSPCNATANLSLAEPAPSPSPLSPGGEETGCVLQAVSALSTNSREGQRASELLRLEPPKLPRQCGPNKKRGPDLTLNSPQCCGAPFYS